MLANRAEDSERASRAAELCAGQGDCRSRRGRGRMARCRSGGGAGRGAAVAGRGRIGTAWPRRRSDFGPKRGDARGRCDRRPLCCRHCRKRSVATLRESLTASQARKERLQALRDEASAKLSAAKAELTGIERDTHSALPVTAKPAPKTRGRTAGSWPPALDGVKVASGYERALAAVLGRRWQVAFGRPPPQTQDGRFLDWRNQRPSRLPKSLLAHLSDCPGELRARLALVHCVETDDGRALAPGEWLVTRTGQLRRWDGFIARGEGAAEAAQLEAAKPLCRTGRRATALARSRRRRRGRRQGSARGTGCAPDRAGGAGT